MSSKRIRVIIETVAWMFFLGIPLFLFPALGPYLGEEKIRPALGAILFTHTYLIGFYYFNYFFALPKYYFARKYLTYFGMAIAWFSVLMLILLSNDNFNPLQKAQFPYATMLFVFSVKVRFLMIFLLSLGLLSYSRLRKAEEEKLKSELNLLRAQVNPHFLFNTLNSIYALSVKKSDNAPESITRLASIMRYVISETSTEYIELSKELKYISDYIDLEKLRLTDKVMLSFTIEGESSGNNIAPLIFIPLIENTFKYGVSTTENSVIDILIRISGKELLVKVHNTKNRTSNSGNGMGIANMKKRLELIYPGRHTFKFKDSEKEYQAELTITLS
jgi:LytS/YehU family sensor histidine kinase